MSEDATVPWPCSCGATSLDQCSNPHCNPSARDAVIHAAVRMVYDGMSDAAWHRIKRAVLAMESRSTACVEK